MARRVMRGRRGWRPATNWSGDVGAVFVTLPAASKVQMAIFVNNTEEDLTIRRVRGLVAVKSDQIAAGEDQLGSFGAFITTETASQVAATAGVPDPVTDVDDDVWLMYQPIAQTFLFGTAVGFHANGAVQYPFDSKAMRKLPTGRVISFVIANASATTGFQFSFNVRILTSVTGA